MTQKPLFCRRFHATKRERAGGATNATPTLEHSQPSKEVGMSRWDTYSDSIAQINQNKREHWQSIGSIAARLVERAAK